MLLSVQIENFALIDRLQIEFGKGLNVLTGETGAGKSIILDAVDVVLGSKVQGRAIRAGADRAAIEATFELDPPTIAWLREQEIDPLDENLLVVSRELVATRGGSMRSRSRLNGILVNRQLMERVRERLVEITAQGQTVQLVQAARQRDWLDNFGGEPLLAQRQRVAEAFAKTSLVLQELERRRQSEQQRLQRIDLLEYQLKELSEADLSEGDEAERLEQERQRLSHVVDLQQQSYQAYQFLYQNDTGEQAAADLLGEVQSILQEIVSYDGSLQAILDMVEDALAQTIEAGRQMSSYSANLEADPDRLEQVERRLVQLQQICRKYGPSLGEAIAYAQSIEAELEQLTGGGKSIEELEQNYRACQGQLKAACDRLTALRRRAASGLEARLLEELKPLAMEKVQFEVQLSEMPPNSTGGDRVVFAIGPNPGEPLQPLHEIASGGELSRFLLALKACFSQADDAVTLVFDEIDAGVSGRVAGAIAQKLHQLSLYHQVLFVTHQPIVAAMAECHFRVDKQLIDAPTPSGEAIDTDTEIATETRTAIRVTPLTPQQRREELAQLAGGEGADAAIAFAQSLLNQAADLRQDPDNRRKKANGSREG
jgi:DNA repair protein RecN (Recombination protein N)